MEINASGADFLENISLNVCECKPTRKRIIWALKWKFVDSCCSDALHEYEMFHLQNKRKSLGLSFLLSEREILENY